MHLDLSKHCIQTEIKRLYNRSVSRYFTLKKEDPQLATDIEMLKTALECLDFPRLRSGYTELAGGQGTRVIELVADDKGRAVVRINGRDIT
ncbi:MAG: hypothetical protein GY697_24985 [Desulfobacterales bacterium]|nr:hypothetical protein [Desulfobacterales bacterium]